MSDEDGRFIQTFSLKNLNIRNQLRFPGAEGDNIKMDVKRNRM
jgi:hypothetical protein